MNYTVTYPIKEEVIAAAFIPQCIRCLHTTILCIIMPYGTDWAGSYICPDCLHELVDPAITAATAARSGKDAK